jgi:hypothetical protein
VTVVSSNRLVVDAVRKYGDGLYTDPDTEVVVQSPRSFVYGHRSRGETGFDVIDVALNDAQQAVVSGAYTLSEDYVYTVQALEDYVAALEPGGLLAIQRWLQTPPSESLRAWALAVTALEQQGKVSPRQSLVAIRSWSTMLILVKNGAFDGPELEMVRQFCADHQFDLVYLPDLRPEETNRFNIYEGAPYARAFGRLLTSEQRAAFYREYSYEVRPPTDDKPYDHHFFRWRQVPEIWRSLGRTWQPFGGSGYLVLVALLVVATLASVALILVPVSLTGQRFRSESDWPVFPVLVYFGCLGFAYLAVEIPLIQRILLYVDHPTTAFATVVTVLLVASGVGSLLAPRARIQWVVPLLALYLVALLVLLPAAVDVLLGYSLATRLAVISLLLAPLGLLMGIPFPAGLALLRERSARLIPWAWGVNGCASVVASVLAPLIALEWGYGVVLGLATAVYVAAWLIIRLAWGVKA